MEYTEEEKEALNFNLDRTLTVDQAVRYMLGYGDPVHYEIDGETEEQTVQELLTLEHERADAEYSNAKYDLAMHQQSQPKDTETADTLQKAVDEKAVALAEMKAMMAKAKDYFRLIQDEIAKAMSGKDSALVIDHVESQRSPHVHITRSSLEEWSESIADLTAGKQGQLPAGVPWEQITIKIHANHRIAVLGPEGLQKRISFSDLGLLDKRTKLPNKHGLILIGLSEGEKYPVARKPQRADKTAISKLRKSLKGILNTKEDPFIEFNPTDGWKPKFKLIDDRNNAADRAKREAFFTTHPEPKANDFEEEDDAAAAFLKELGY